MHGQSRDQDGDQVDRNDVGNGHRDRAEEAREQERRAPDRPDDERLQQPAFGVAAHRAEREEDRQHDPEEHRREQRETGEKRGGEGARVDRHVARHDQCPQLAVDEVIRDPEEDEEDDGQQQHDGEHAPPQRFTQDVADDHGDCTHDVSPPTASR